MNRLCLVLALGVAATIACAQPHDHRGLDRHRDDIRIIVYEDAGFRGDARVLFPGESIENMSGLTFENGAKLNDRISSIRIEGDAEVLVYENAHYRGEALRLTDSVRDLTGRFVSGSVSVSWNDRISSLRVERGGNRPTGRPAGDPERTIKRVFDDLLGRAPDSGELRDFRSRLIDQGWTEKMLRDHLRREDRYRIEAADIIIRRAYHEVLDREPDPSGLKQYRWALLEKNWTEGDVCDDLRRSDEYRKKPRGH